MKKFLWLILCTVLLASCVNNNKPLETNGEEPTAEPEVRADEPSSFAERLAALEPFEMRSEITSRFFDETVYELILRDDYGKLYPFPAGNRLYGLMTADGRIVVDGVYEWVQFIDVDDGYYHVVRSLPAGGQWDYGYRENIVMTADGSRMVSVSDGHIVVLPGGRILVFEFVYIDEINDELISIIDMDGNVISPPVSRNENYKFFYMGGMVGSHGLYVNINTGEFFTGIQHITLTEENARVRLTEDGGLDALIKYTADNPDLVIFFYLPGARLQLSENIFAETRIVDNVHAQAITDADGNVLISTQYGMDIFGNILLDYARDAVYDLEFNRIEVPFEGRFRAHIGGDTYTFGDWDSGIFFIDISDGSRLDFPEEYSYGRLNDEFVSAWGVFDRRFKQGVFTHGGEMVLPVIYEQLTPLRDGLFEAHVNNYIGVKNTDGEWIIRIDSLKYGN